MTKETLPAKTVAEGMETREVSTTSALTSTDSLLAGIHPSFQVEAVTVVTRPVLVQEDNVPFAVRIEKPFEIGEEIQSIKRDGQAKMQPAHIAFVVNMATGEEQTLIGNAVLRAELDRAYPGDGYVGRCFAIMPLPKKTNKSGNPMRTYAIKELIVKSRK